MVLVVLVIGGTGSAGCAGCWVLILLRRQKGFLLLLLQSENFMKLGCCFSRD